MDIKEKVRQFVMDNFYVSESERFCDEASLLMEGIIDSTGVMELIVFLEKTFGVKVPDEDLLPENLDSLNRIEAYVQRKQAE